MRKLQSHELPVAMHGDKKTAEGVLFDEIDSLRAAKDDLLAALLAQVAVDVDVAKHGLLKSDNALARTARELRDAAIAKHGGA